MLTDGRDREADDPLPARRLGVVLGGDHEALRVRGMHVAVVALHDREVVRDLRLVERHDVVVDRDAPDLCADRESSSVAGRTGSTSGPGAARPERSRGVVAAARVAVQLPAGRQPFELRLHERVKVAVEDRAVLPVS